MNRRGFLGAIAAAVAGATLDPEKLLWVPGRKLISIPRPMLHPLPPPLEPQFSQFFFETIAPALTAKLWQTFKGHRLLADQQWPR